MENETVKFISRRGLLFPVGMTCLTLLLGLLLSLQLGSLDTDRRLSDTRTQVTHELATVHARLEGVVNSVFSVTSGLTNVIAHQGEIPPDLFEALARQAIKGHPQIRNVAAAPNNVITLLYPLEGNRQVLGINYADIPEQYEVVYKAMQTKSPIFSGPHNLLQGGRGLIARMPVFTRVGVPPESDPRYWGIVSVVTDVDALLDAGGVRSSDILDIGLLKIDDLGAIGTLICGNETLVHQKPVRMDIAIPGGKWQLIAVPKGGWSNLAATRSPLFLMGVVLTLFSAAYICWLVVQPYRERLRNKKLWQEITERVQAEELLRLSEQKYASIFQLMPDMVGITRMVDGTFLEINEAFTRIAGWKLPELIGRTSVEVGLWTAEARARAVAIVREKGRLENYEFILGTKSGEKRNALMFLVPIKVRGEDCLYFIARDISELKEAQRVLEYERVQLRKLLQTIPALVWMKDPNGLYIFCNARFERLLGAPEPKIIGKSDYDFFSRELADFFRANDRMAISVGQPRLNEEWLTYADDGHRELVETIKTPVHGTNGQFIGVLGVAWDITVKQKIEEELRQERTRFINLVDSVDGIVWESDAETFTFTYVSGQAQRLLGYTSATWYQEGFWFNHLHPDDREKVRDYSAACTARGEDYNFEYRFIAQDGRIFWIQDFVSIVMENGLPRWRRGIMVDTTNRKKEEKEKENLETQLRQAQKMEAVGRLAGGVAHDFNNQLSVILGYADLMKEGHVTPEKSRGYLNQIIRAAAQARDITRQLLAFSRQEKIAPRVLNLNTLVKSVQKGMGRFIREDIRFEVKLAESLWPINIDPTQMDQVLMNLIVNARDAMADGGRLEVETKNIALDAAFTDEHPEITREGDYVQLTVSDTGCGMSPETLQHIFEPFYTTKETGKGTGLGLATVYGIVTQNKGLVLVESTLRTGSTFRVFFPRCWEEERQEVVEGSVEPVRARSSATILLVEDEETVRQMTTDILEQSGYITLAAATPQEAIALCSRKDQQIDLLLTDVIMPEINGRELSRQIESMRPGIKVLFMSGYAADIISEAEVTSAGTPFIQKPFNVQSLLDKIEEQLQGDGKQGV